MFEINAEELMRQAKLSKVQFVGGPRDGDKLKPLSFKIEHLVNTHCSWWTDKNSVSFYLLSKKDEDYCMMYVGSNVDKLLDLTSEVYGKVPQDLLQVVPLLRSMEKGCNYESLHGTDL